MPLILSDYSSHGLGLACPVLTQGWGFYELEDKRYRVSAIVIKPVVGVVREGRWF